MAWVSSLTPGRGSSSSIRLSMRSVSSLDCLTLKSASSRALRSERLSSFAVSSSTLRLPFSSATEPIMRRFSPSSAMPMGPDCVV